MGVKLVSEAGMIRTGEQAQLSEDGVDADRAPTYAELQQLRDMRRELNEHYRADARSGLLRESVMEAARSLPAVLVA